jgi:hypothetical protein
MNIEIGEKWAKSGNSIKTRRKTPALKDGSSKSGDTHPFGVAHSRRTRVNHNPLK